MLVDMQTNQTPHTDLMRFPFQFNGFVSQTPPPKKKKQKQ